MRLRSDFVGLGHVGGRPPGPQAREPLSAWEPTKGVALQRDRCQPSTTVRGASASPVLRGKGRADTSGCWLASLGKHSRRAAQDLRSTPHAAVADDPLTRRQRRARGADVVLEGPLHSRSPHDMHVFVPRPRACTCTLLTSPPSQCLILRASSSASAPLPSLLLLIIIHRYRPYFVTIWLTTIIVTSTVDT